MPEDQKKALLTQALQIAIAGAHGDQTLESAQAAIYTLAQGEGMAGPDLLNAAFGHPWTLEELEGYYTKGTFLDPSIEEAEAWVAPEDPLHPWQHLHHDTHCLYLPTATVSREQTIHEVTRDPETGELVTREHTVTVSFKTPSRETPTDPA